MRDASKTTKRAAARGDGLTAEERAAMKETLRERKAQAGGKTDGAADLKAAIARMAEPDRTIAERVSELVAAAAPGLEPRTWYGMPAWSKDGKTLCFFQNAGKFKARYNTFGFNDTAALDDGNMWPTSFALTRLTRADEARITALVKQAAG